MAFHTRVRTAVVCLLAVTGATWSAGAAQTAPSTDTDIRTLPLLDQHGTTTSLHDLEGRTTVLHFIFTRCVAACPLQLKSLREVRDALPAGTRARVQFVSVSLDPEHDTPEVLRRYAQANRIDGANWRLATASADIIDRLTRGFGVKRQPIAEDQIDHTVTVLLFDPRGHLFQRYAGALDTARLVREIGDVVRLFDTEAAQ